MEVLRFLLCWVAVTVGVGAMLVPFDPRETRVKLTDRQMFVRLGIAALIGLCAAVVAVTVIWPR